MNRFLSVTLAACLALTAATSIANAVISDAQKQALKQALGGDGVANTLGNELTTAANAIATVTPGTAKASSPVVLDASKGVSGLEIISAGQYRRENGTTFTAADPNPSRATLRGSAFWLVDTTANVVDLDFSDDADLEAADIGTEWLFYISAGGTNALTITAGATGVTPTVMQAGAGATCEDVGDSIRCVAVALEAVRCFSVCAD